MHCQYFGGLVLCDISVLAAQAAWSVVSCRGMCSAFQGRCRVGSRGVGLHLCSQRCGLRCMKGLLRMSGEESDMLLGVGVLKGEQGHAKLCASLGQDNSDARAYRTGDKDGGLEAQAGQSYLRMQGAENKFFTQFGAMLALPKLQPALGDREGPREGQRSRERSCGC